MNENTRRHTVSLTDRALLTVTAVDEVLSFDETLVNLDIGGTMLSVSGRELSVTKLMLESGEVCIKGQIEAIVYELTQKSKGVFSRVFK